MVGRNLGHGLDSRDGWPEAVLLIFEYTHAYARWTDLYRFLSACRSIRHWTKIM